ncbi:MAG: cytochrome c biogenesis protein CcdA [Deltaproteobacteria bacterium]|nr:cytochrome c biogenesis protein CcdA [Deltaproteobacteria bacterium]
MPTPSTARRSPKHITSLAVALTVFLLPILAFAGTDDGDLFSRLLGRYGISAALAGAFLGGLMTAGTGCVYPMIGITVSVFGANKTTSRARSLVLSTAFVHGIAAFYVPLGLAAGLSGSLFGALAGNKYVLIVEATLMFIMAASMFGLFDIQLPASLQTRLSSMGGLGVRGAFVVGLVLGPIAAPCATAPLAGILSFIFRTKNALHGVGALYAYSLGLGLPFFLVGAFAMGLPKPGRWMNLVKSILAFVLLIVGLWYLRQLLPFLAQAPRALAPRVSLALAIVAAVIGIGFALKASLKIEKIGKITAFSLSAVAAVWWLGAESHVSSGACRPVVWQRDLAAAQQLARREHRPLLVDFGATWCRACEELAHRTLPTAAVACALQESNFVTVKLYENEQGEERFEGLQRQWNVRSLPAVIVLDAAGHEVARVNEFIEPAAMAAIVRRVRP